MGRGASAPAAPAAAATTAKSGAVVPPAVRDLAVLIEECTAIRTCPLAEVELRATTLALRIANAEGLLWEMQQVRHAAIRALAISAEPYDRDGTPGLACAYCGSVWPANEKETDAQHGRECPMRPVVRS